MTDLSRLSDADLQALYRRSNGDFTGDVRAAAERYGVRPDLALAVMRQESGGRADARSPKGAVGPMQLMPGTAADLGVDPTDPVQNIDGGVRYLKQQLDDFGGDERLALAAYNAGPQRVREAGGVPDIPETKNYVNSILGDQGEGGMADLSGLSNEELTDLYRQTAPPAPTAKAGGVTVTVEPRAKPNIPAKAQPVAIPRRGAVEDAFTGFGAGALSGLGSVADTLLSAGPMGLLKGELGALGSIADLAAGKIPTKVRSGSINAASRAADLGYRPSTDAGKVARTVGTMLPNAAIPGSVPQRILNVILPAFGQEAGERTAKAAGLGERGQQIAGAVGAGLGGLGTAVRVGPKPKLDAKSLEEVKTASDRAWAKVDASGYRFPQPDVEQAAGDIRAIVNEAGPELYPRATQIAKRVEDLAARGDLTPAQANRLRSQIGEKLLAPGSDEVSVGRAIKDRIDQLINAADDPNLATARNLYTRYVKMREVSDRAASADLRASSTYAGGNKANATRQSLRPLIDPKSKQRIRNFTPDEQRAMTRVVEGSPSANLARVTGKVLDPRGLLGAGVQTAFGIPSHGLTTLSAPVGMVASEASNRATMKALQDALDLISAGGVRPAPPPLSPYAGAAAVTAPMIAIPTTAAAQPRRKDRRPK